MIKEFDDNDIRELQDIVRIGIVSSVNKEKMTARVKIEEQGIVTGDLRIVQNTPFMVMEWKDAGVKWNYEADYAQYDRKLGIGDRYKEEYPYILHTWKGTADRVIKVYPWIPYIGQWVLCILKPEGEGDGFIIGGI